MIISVFIAYGSLALLIVPGIIFGVYTAFSLFALVVDGKKGFEALLESYSLVKGRWWAVFGRIAFLALVAAGMFICYGIAVFIISFVTSSIMPAQMSAFIPMVLMITMEIIILSFSIVYLYQLYSSLKLTRQIDVQISSAKPWLVAFMIIGIVVAIAYISIVAVTVNSGFNQMSQSVHYQTQINHNNF